MLLKAALHQGASALSAGAAPQQARRDAELLLMHTLHCTRAFVMSHPETELAPAQLEQYGSAVLRRQSGEPVQHITGEQEFYGLRFQVTRDVLIPRPETEHLVEALLARVDHHAPVRIVDVGTGSGAIAVALAKHLPLAELAALDISTEALEVAQANAQAHGVTGRIRFLHSDLLRAVIDERFDVLVSNPPYIALPDRDTLAPEVREHEPSVALFGGPSGLDIYRRLIPEARRVLPAGGLLLMEIGYGQREAVRQLLSGWSDIAFLPDLQGVPRVACAIADMGIVISTVEPSS